MGTVNVDIERKEHSFYHGEFQVYINVEFENDTDWYILIDDYSLQRKITKILKRLVKDGHYVVIKIK